MVNQDKHDLLSYEYLWERFSIDADGDLVWKTHRKKTYIGRKAWYVRPDGYRSVCLRIEGKDYHFYAHRLLYFMQKGTWPKNDIDHRDRNRSNNRKDNLRDVSRSKNMRNTQKHLSGDLGVHFDKDRGKWQVSFRYDSRRHWGGRFAEKKDAYEKRDLMLRRLESHGM